MIQEKSCGAVVFTVQNGRRLYLVEHMQKGHTSICKGHVEGRETERETAAREIREETGLAVTFIDGFSRTIRYSPYEGCVKDVIFFLAKAETTETTAQPEEVSAIEWAELPEALAMLTHQSDRETVLAADKYLNAHARPDSFRPMRRQKRQMGEGECEDILSRATSGVLSLAGDEGWPYGVPLSFVYEDGKIYFHGAKKGQKLDAARNSARASFCVIDRDEVDAEHYTTNYKSVIAFGTIRELTDSAQIRAAIELLAKKYNPADSEEHREKFILDELAAMAMLSLEICHMTGKERK